MMISFSILFIKYIYIFLCVLFIQKFNYNLNFVKFDLIIKVFKKIKIIQKYFIYLFLHILIVMII